MKALWLGCLCLIFGWIPNEGPLESPPEFYRAFNLNGPSLWIDERLFEGDSAPGLECNGGAFENAKVSLYPKVGPTAAKMIRSSRWSRELKITLHSVPNDSYQVFVYAWEDNKSTFFDVSVNGKTVLEKFRSGAAGNWKRLGPWSCRPVDGKIEIHASGGDANISGLELWRGDGTVPAPDLSGFRRRPSPDELTFFESKIRPILIERCYECHSAESREVGGGLLLDSRNGIVASGSTEQAIVPGDPQASLLYRAILYQNHELQMPPSGRLDADQVESFRRWIEMGAPDPRVEDTTKLRRERKSLRLETALDHWSLKPLSDQAAPVEREDLWSKGGIDAWVLASMRANELVPSHAAKREHWLRRVTFDLTGLPPTPEEVWDYLSDSAPDCDERLVDRLLATRAFGERWGRHWLDVVRYADTAGDNSDFPIPQNYRYRNWVLDAICQDLPYDRFVTEQIAGDLLESQSLEERNARRIATGYLAGARRFGSRVDDYPQHLTIEDTIDNLGRAFLGMTLSCARCHDHKFDPVTTEDYYALYGIFQSTRYPWPGIELEQRQRDLVPLVDEAHAQRVLDERAEKERELERNVKTLTALFKDAKEDARKELEGRLTEAKKATEQFKNQALPFEVAYGVVDSTTIEDAHVQVKGDPLKKGPEVKRRFLAVLGGGALAEGDRTSGRRQLANWIVGDAKRLTARVMVNRVWLHHFGRGLVETPNDFGCQGKPPTHPELLDWLSRRLIDGDWSLKKLHREIVLSATYRQSCTGEDSQLTKDPSNVWLSRFSRRRLDAESLRDTLLQASGSLDRTIGSAHPFPPPSEWKFTQHHPFKAHYPTQRRSVYMMIQRIQKDPFLATFDGADAASSTPQRLVSTTPIQALYFLNDPFVHERAKEMEERLRPLDRTDSERIQRLYWILLGREAKSQELRNSMEFLQQVRILKEAHGATGEAREKDAWQSLIRAMIRLNEFLYLD